MTTGAIHPAIQWRERFTQGAKVQAWIIIEAEAWAQLQVAGELVCPESFAAPGEEFQTAYSWMRQQMTAAGVLPPGEGLSPWWVWVQRAGGHSAPYLEDLAGVRAPVVLELALPASDLVLSCFDAWHAVLNRWFLYQDQAESDEFEALEAAGSPDAESRLRHSWLNVFDLGHLYGDATPLSARSVQGCIWALRLDQVTRVVSHSELETTDDEPD
ncbi:DUF3841 domain-containing protein [Pseudomonas sp. GOM6]|uniref:DUF3841 domain-containing protein n=1 Tax=Pseudomonas sp. GOM6 TaxID=3036944 RepID=UPI00240A3346|nr:DUF3841 domain-containing protein [Pseudomonas sp. GOM6]MDG1581011.1 DUF3841 domain-containing protein [Pseudomonas sp. GOM6]